MAQGKKENIIGNKYNMLTVIDEYWDKEKKKSMLRVKCECGKEFTTRKDSVTSFHKFIIYKLF